MLPAKYDSSEYREQGEIMVTAYPFQFTAQSVPPQSVPPETLPAGQWVYIASPDQFFNAGRQGRPEDRAASTESHQRSKSPRTGHSASTGTKNSRDGPFGNTRARSPNPKERNPGSQHRTSARMAFNEVSNGDCEPSLQFHSPAEASRVRNEQADNVQYDNVQSSTVFFAQTDPRNCPYVYSEPDSSMTELSESEYQNDQVRQGRTGGCKHFDKPYFEDPENDDNGGKQFSNTSRTHVLQSLPGSKPKSSNTQSGGQFVNRHHNQRLVTKALCTMVQKCDGQNKGCSDENIETEYGKPCLKWQKLCSLMLKLSPHRSQFFDKNYIDNWNKVTVSRINGQKPLSILDLKSSDESSLDDNEDIDNDDHDDGPDDDHEPIFPNSVAFWAKPQYSHLSSQGKVISLYPMLWLAFLLRLQLKQRLKCLANPAVKNWQRFANQILSENSSILYSSVSRPILYWSHLVISILYLANGKNKIPPIDNVSFTQRVFADPDDIARDYFTDKGLHTDANWQNSCEFRIFRLRLRRLMLIRRRNQFADTVHMPEISRKLRSISRWIRRFRARYLKPGQAFFRQVRIQQDNDNFDEMLRTFTDSFDAEGMGEESKHSDDQTYSQACNPDLQSKLKRHLRENFVNHVPVLGLSLFLDGFPALTESSTDACENFTYVSNDDIPEVTVSDEPETVLIEEIQDFLLNIDLRSLTPCECRILFGLINAATSASTHNDAFLHFLKVYKSTVTEYPLFLSHPNRLFQVLLDQLPPSIQLCADTDTNTSSGSNHQKSNIWTELIERSRSVYIKATAQVDSHVWDDTAQYFVSDASLSSPLVTNTSDSASDMDSVTSSPVDDPTNEQYSSVIKAHKVRALFAGFTDMAKESTLNLKDYAISDSGCPISITNDKSLLRNTRKCHYIIQTAQKNSSANITSSLCGNFPNSLRDITGTIHDRIIKDVLYTPEVPLTLLGTYQLNLHFHRVVHNYPYPSYLSVNRSHIVPFEVSKEGLYLLPIKQDQVRNSSIPVQESFNKLNSHAFSAVIAQQSKNYKQFALWHCRLCHIGIHALCKAHHHIIGMPAIQQDLDQSTSCQACSAAKLRRSNKQHSETQPARILEWWSVDSLIVKLKGIIGAVTLALFVDEYTRYCIAFPNVSRAEHLLNMKSVMTFLKFLGTKLDKDLKMTTVKTDGGAEYETLEMLKFYLDNNIQHHTTTPHNPRQNGLVERRGGTIMQMMRTCMQAANVPEKFWPYAALHAVFIHNRLPQVQDVSGKLYSPFELIYQKKALAKDIHVFGCLVYLFLPRSQHGNYTRNWKTSCRGLPCAFLGVGHHQGQKCYQGWCFELKKVFVSDTGQFYESFYPWRPPESREVNGTNFFKEELNLPEDIPKVLRNELPWCSEQAVTVMDLDPHDDIWSYENPDALVTVTVLCDFHTLQQEEVLLGEQDIPEVFTNLQEISHDHWVQNMDLHQSLGTIENHNIEHLLTNQKRSVISHPYTIQSNLNSQRNSNAKTGFPKTEAMSFVEFILPAHRIVNRRIQLVGCRNRTRIRYLVTAVRFTCVVTAVDNSNANNSETSDHNSEEFSCVLDSSDLVSFEQELALKQKRIKELLKHPDIKKVTICNPQMETDEVWSQEATNQKPSVPDNTDTLKEDKERDTSVQNQVESSEDFESSENSSQSDI